MDRIVPTSSSSASPRERRETRRAHLAIVDLGELKVKRQTGAPGWKSPAHIDPPLFLSPHVGCAVSGIVHVVLEGGEELDVGAGDVFVTLPGRVAA